MAHFAELDYQYNVIRVIVVNNNQLENLEFPDSEAIGISFCRSLFGNETNWIQTSYNGTFRGKFAGIGDKYDHINDVFVQGIVPV